MLDISEVKVNRTVVSDSLQSHGLLCPAPLSMEILQTMCCLFLLQGIFLTKGWNPGSEFQADSLPTEPQIDRYLDSVHPVSF